MKKIIVNSKTSECSGICMITGPLPDSIVEADIIHISGLLHLLKPLGKNIFIISSNLPESLTNDKNIHIHNIKNRSFSRNTFLRIFMFVVMQSKISSQLFRIRNNIEIVFFSIGAGVLVLPVFLAKLMNKKIIYIYAGKGVIKQYSGYLLKENFFGWKEPLIFKIINLLELSNCHLSNKIVSNSSNIDTFLLKRYRSKISIISRFYVNLNTFSEEKDRNHRELLIGYIGKFDEGKGIVNFIEAIPLVKKSISRAKFIICGRGTLQNEVNILIKNNMIDDIVTVTDWVPHETLPKYLNKIKLLVIPSNHEIGPQILFESMACGTLVLATPVGVVPDVIIDGKNGFVLENNSPECISKNIVRIFNNPFLNEISKNARNLMETEYSYDSTVKRYRKLFDEL